MNLPRSLASDFLLAFARAEYALKGIQRFCSGAEGESASPNWDRFASKVATALSACSEIDYTVRQLLLAAPPLKEVVRNGIAVFEALPLVGPEGVQLILAVRRARKNVFHGGKVHGERYQGHDQQFVTAALEVRAAMPVTPR